MIKLWVVLVVQALLVLFLFIRVETLQQRPELTTSEGPIIDYGHGWRSFAYYHSSTDDPVMYLAYNVNPPPGFSTKIDPKKHAFWMAFEASYQGLVEWNLGLLTPPTPLMPDGIDQRIMQVEIPYDGSGGYWSFRGRKVCADIYTGEGRMGCFSFDERALKLYPSNPDGGPWPSYKLEYAAKTPQGGIVKAYWQLEPNGDMALYNNQGVKVFSLDQNGKPLMSP